MHHPRIERPVGQPKLLLVEQVHQQERQIIKRRNPGIEIIELDAIEKRGTIPVEEHVSQMQITVTVPHVRRLRRKNRAKPRQQTLPSLQRSRHVFRSKDRRQRNEICCILPCDARHGRRPVDTGDHGLAVMEGGHTARQPLDIAITALPPHEALVEQATVRKAPHFQKPFDDRARPLQREAGSLPRDRHDPQIKSRRRSPVERKFPGQHIVACRQRGKIEEPEIHRALHLEGPITCEEHVRSMRLDHLRLLTPGPARRKPAKDGVCPRSVHHASHPEPSHGLSTPAGCIKRCGVSTTCQGLMPPVALLHCPAQRANRERDMSGNQPTSEELNERQRSMSDGLASIVAIMMRDRRFRDVRLADLDWLVMPPILVGQWKIARGTMTPSKGANTEDGGRIFPVAAALWACVSPEVDARLSADLDKPLILKPGEWQSGDIIWLIAVPGQPAYVKQLLKHLQETTFQGKQVKIRTADPAGKPAIRTLDALVSKA